MAWTENLQKTEGDWRFSRMLEEELGMQVYVSISEEKAAFRDATQPVVLDFIRGNVGDALVDELFATVDEARSQLYGN